jgi:hypothetical protein
MADGNPFQSALNPNLRNTSLWDLRMMSSANRMETPFERGARQSYGSHIAGNPMLSGMVGMSNEPDYSSFTYNPQLHQEAINAGVQPLEANQVKHNTFLPNTGFFGNHPRLSAAIEGAAYGGLAAHGGMTTGESIQGALEGIIGGHQMQQGMYRQQFARPFEAAGAMERLRDMQATRQMRDAQVKHFTDESEIQRERIAEQQSRDDAHLSATRPVPDATGTWVYGEKTPGGNFNGLPFEGSPGGWTHQSVGGRQSADHDLDIGTRTQLKAMGVDPNNATPEQINTANTKSQNQKIATGAAIAGAGANSRIPAQNYADALKVHDQRMEDYNKKILKSDDPASQTAARSAIMMDRMAKGNDNLLPTNEEIKTWINQQNAGIQQQIDSETKDFKQKWPQAMEAPPAPKGRKTSPPRTGSATEGTQDNPHVIK